MGNTAYQLAKRIARGGMAEIYLGKAVGEDAFQRICAIKRILPHYAQDREFIQMFRDEAHICKRLQHANIVQVYDFTEVDNSYALIMEYVDGADLRTLLSACEDARIRLHVPMALYVAACAARGLHYAHTKTDEISNQPLGIVHRDISPQNILISYEGEVKITDFGIADADGKMTETRPGVVKGKYSYMSPEQIASKSLDGRSDVFSLAIVLWECLAMKRLFAGQTEVETIRKVQNCEIPNSLKELNPDVDNELMEIVNVGLARDRKKRYQTAASFEKAILKYLHSHYPDFTGSELGNFLKQILAKKRGETQDDIKNTLTITDLSKGGNNAPSLLDAIKEKVRQNVEAAPAAEGAGLPELPPMTGNGTISLDLSTSRNVVASSSINPRGGASMRSAMGSSASPQSVNMHYRDRGPGRNAEFRAVKDANKRFVTTLAFLLFLGLAIVVFIKNRSQQLGEEKMQVKLTTVPDAVMIKLDGVALQDGAYLRSPIKLSLKPGSYQLQVSRIGYRSDSVEVKGGNGDDVIVPTVSLRKAASAYVNVKIVADEKLVVNVENGLAKGETPLFIPNLAVGQSHNLVFYYESSGTKKAGRCPFVPQKTHRSRSYGVKISGGKGSPYVCRIQK